MYAWGAGPDGLVYTVDASVSNPLIVKGTEAHELTDALREAGIDPLLRGSELTPELKRRGYDSVLVYKSGSDLVNELVLFDPNAATWIGNATSHMMRPCKKNTLKRLIQGKRLPCFSRIAP